MTIEISEPQSHPLPEYVQDELANYEQQIRKYRAGEVDETKMQKLRLHFGTYAQRQEGVQMQRIKIPGGVLSSGQLIRLADAADRFGSGFLHFTTREDAQITMLSWKKLLTSCATWPKPASPLAKLAVTLYATSPRAIAQARLPRRHSMCCLIRRRCFAISCATSTTKIWTEIQDYV